MLALPAAAGASFLVQELAIGRGIVSPMEIADLNTQLHLMSLIPVMKV